MIYKMNPTQEWHESGPFCQDHTPQVGLKFHQIPVHPDGKTGFEVGAVTMCLPVSLRPLCKTRAVGNSSLSLSLSVWVMVWVHLFNRRFIMKFLSTVANETGATTE